MKSWQRPPGKNICVHLRLASLLFVSIRVHSRLWFQGLARMPVNSGTIKELDRRAKILVWFGALLLKLLMRTLRCEVKDEAGFFAENAPKPVVTLIWHNRMLGLTTAFSRHYPARKGALVLASASRDGAYLAEFVRNFGVGAVRGSTSRRGSAALLDLVRKLGEGYDICITPDGPRGPRYSLGPGAVLLAQLCKVPLMPLLIEYSSYWRLKSWDGFAIPKPFSKVEVTIMPLIDIAPSVGDGKFEAERLRVQAIMTERLKMR
jgi:lysophospholipid acyltransferase (LPLAT)-like uncharacterized protein